MKASIPFIVFALISIVPAWVAAQQTATPVQGKEDSASCQLRIYVNPDWTNDQLADQFEQSQQAVASRFKELERSLPSKVQRYENQSPKLTKTDIQKLNRTWQAYQKQYCSYWVKQYDLNYNEENRVMTYCMIGLNQMQFCMMQDF